MKLQKWCIECLLGLGLVGAGVLWSANAGSQPQENTTAVPVEPDPGNLRTFIKLVRSDIKTHK